MIVGMQYSLLGVPFQRDAVLDISVIVPTHNRRAVLSRTLTLLDAQVGVGGDIETVVADDASTDGTSETVAAAARRVGYPVRYLRLERNAGPSAARNRALAVAQGRIVLFIGDDILPDPGFLGAHLRWHAAHPAATAAMVGHTRWADEMPRTALLTWLELRGTQFCYGDMRDGAVVDYGRFYTSNVSLKRAFLDASGCVFDERLRFCEDSEFAGRLAGAGMTLHYNAAASAQHLHPTTLASSIRRMGALGRDAATLESVSPENFARITGGAFSAGSALRGRLLRALLSPALGRLVYTPLAALCARRIAADRLFAAAHASAFLSGLRAARAGRAS
ncbi:glycosyltransferase [bacterium]|nr:glycosyltransferase [bacterium]PIY75140.1 MAG: hypothetical protein COY86_00570 [Rhodobacterales bacterium CG_4_10_14_0_8_um_filter_70_9]PJA59443.1 MAG: hypothetical protein CO163_09315 [Rhodobacterales bacterium CG_4_9_14_3_um_filter_71_31]